MEEGALFALFVLPTVFVLLLGFVLTELLFEANILFLDVIVCCVLVVELKGLVVELFVIVLF